MISKAGCVFVLDPQLNLPSFGSVGLLSGFPPSLCGACLWLLACVFLCTDTVPLSDSRFQIHPDSIPCTNETLPPGQPQCS